MINRRDALKLGALTLLGCRVPLLGDPMKTKRMPVVYLPHGGGPWPFVDVNFGPKASWDSLRAYLESLSQATPEKPKLLLVISAHWEEETLSVTGAKKHPLYYDYYGFPEESYQIEWPAPGDEAAADRVQELLAAAGFNSKETLDRGYDHGTFVPLKLTYPDADIPVVQLSLRKGLDPTEHIEIGQSLESLRDEGVLIVGSGMSYHNMRGFGRQTSVQSSHEFDGWLGETLSADAETRNAGLARWEHAPSARACHPREEHLLPLMVVAGAAGEDVANLAFRDEIMGVRVSAAHFG